MSFLAISGLLLSFAMLAILRSGYRLNAIGVGLATLFLGLGLFGAAFLPLEGPLGLVTSFALGCGLVILYGGALSRKKGLRPPATGDRPLGPKIRWFFQPDGTFCADISFFQRDPAEVRRIRPLCEEFRAALAADPQRRHALFSKAEFHASECPHCRLLTLSNREPGSRVEACWSCGGPHVLRPVRGGEALHGFAEQIRVAMAPPQRLLTFFAQPSAPELREAVDACCRGRGMARLESPMDDMLRSQMVGANPTPLDPERHADCYVLVMEGGEPTADLQPLLAALRAIDPGLRSASFS